MPKKTVIVGLGGTGDWVLTFLKSRLYAAYGEDSVQKDVQFLLVDTIHAKTREGAFGSESKKFQVQSPNNQHEEEVADLGGVRVEPHEYLPLTGEIHQVAESIRKGDDAHTAHLSWFSADYYLRALPAAAMNITDGAGQWRQFGRIALALSAERGEFMQRIDRLIRNLHLASGDEAMFYLVSSLAGGTGAGTFLDAAALIREVAREARVKVWIVGFLVLPSAFKKVLGENTMEATVTRSYAAFRELIRFQTQAGQRVPFTVPYSLNKTVEVNAKLFDTVFLFDATAEWKNLSDVPPWSGISPSIADGLEVFIDRTAGSAILQNLINASARMASEVRIDQTLPAQFHSMGSYKIVLPARQYAILFSSQFVIDFLQGVVSAVKHDGVATLQRTDHAEDEYAILALESLRKIPNLFTEIADMLGDGARNIERLKSFSTRPLDDYRSYLRPKQMPNGLDLQMLMDNPVKAVPTGKEIGDSADDAAKRIVRDCDRRLHRYWEKLGETLEAVVAQVDAEIGAEIQLRVGELLNRKNENFQQHSLGTAVAFLDQIALLCDDLSSKVLSVTESAIDAQRSGQNSLGHWETQISRAQSALEATKGCDGLLRRARAHAAQSEYLSVQSGYIQRRRLAELFKSYQAIVRATRNRVFNLAQQLRDWAAKATLSDQTSARAHADRQISKLESALYRGGETFTSSYGLQAYTQGAAVDTGMGGYRTKLYKRYARPLVDAWLADLEWSYQDENLDGIDKGGFRLRVPAAGIMLEARSGLELYHRVFDRVRTDLDAPVTGLSIFDYFIEQGLTPQAVQDFLKTNCGPLIGQLVTHAGAGETREIHLLAQQPKTPSGAAFLNDLRGLLKKGWDRELPQDQDRDFDNPYTLTLLYLVQDIRQGQVKVMNDYEDKYDQHLLEGDSYVVNHVFTCEQEAARIEKEYRLERGIEGKGADRRLHPRVVRLLDRPQRMLLFLELWALDIARMELDPEDLTRTVWMLLPPGNDDPAGSRVVWLTASSGRDVGHSSARSPLLAMEQFCMGGKSAKPLGAIKIDYPSLEKALKQARNALIDSTSATPNAALLAKYRAFIDKRLPDLIGEECVELHSAAEAADLVTVATHYLKKRLKDLKPRH